MKKIFLLVALAMHGLSHAQSDEPVDSQVKSVIEEFFTRVEKFGADGFRNIKQYPELHAATALFGVVVGVTSCARLFRGTRRLNHKMDLVLNMLKKAAEQKKA